MIRGYGKDDDCNPATPDAVCPSPVATLLRADRASYTSGQTATLLAQLSHEGYSGVFGLLGAELRVEDENGSLLHSESMLLGPLAPGRVLEHAFVTPTSGWPTGRVTATLFPKYRDESLPEAMTGFDVTPRESVFSGRITAPGEVALGRPIALAIEVTNDSDAEVADAVLRVRAHNLLAGEVAEDPVAGWSFDLVSLSPGQTHTPPVSLPSVGMLPGGLALFLTVTLDGAEQIPHSTRWPSAGTHPKRVGAVVRTTIEARSSHRRLLHLERTTEVAYGAGNGFVSKPGPPRWSHLGSSRSLSSPSRSPSSRCWALAM